MQPGSLGDNIQLGDLEALVSEANLLDPLLSINLEPQEVLQALQVQDSASPRLPAQPPAAPGAPIPPTNGCWGPKLSGLGNGCTPGFTVGKNHFKNKFCEACRANGLWLPHSRVRAITADQQELFTNKHQQGVWTEKTLADGHHVQYRLANHTQHCSGPWLLVFSSPSSVPALEWAPMPRHWLHRGGEWVRLIVTKGTLTPVRVQVDEEGGASPSSDSQASLLTALPVGGKSGPAWKRSKAVSASSSTDDARSAGDAASVSDAASTGDPEGGEEPSGVRLTLASLHERLTALVLQQFNRPREALEADGIDERQREAFLEMLAPVSHLVGAASPSPRPCPEPRAQLVRPAVSAAYRPDLPCISPGAHLGRSAASEARVAAAAIAPERRQLARPRAAGRRRAARCEQERAGEPSGSKVSCAPASASLSKLAAALAFRF